MQRCKPDPAWWLAVALALVVVPPAAAAAPAGAVWAVDPEDPGPSLPPAGRSLFDFLVTRRQGDGGVYDVPFPYAALLARVEARLGPGADTSTEAAGLPPLARVLIPLGRSLQRNAAAPDFFRYPRAVAAVVGEGQPAPGGPLMLLRDRLYLGYQERAAILEVISYNEAAGRFEFQLVKDYRPRGEPRVYYANRAICTACHQGASPIFARQLWDETNANRGVIRLLEAEGRDFYGFPVDQGVDVPYDVDVATDRANLFAADQVLWRQGCAGDGAAGARCRGAALIAALQSALTGGRAFDRASRRFREDFAAPLAQTFAERWPRGLLIPDPDIPNRDPLRTQAAAVKVVSVPASLTAADTQVLGEVVRGAQIPAQLEPLNARPPLERWGFDGSFGGGRGVGDGDVSGAGAAERLVAGLGQFLAAADLRRLDEQLFARGEGAGARRETFSAPCRLLPRRRGAGVDRIKFRCAEAPDAGGSAAPAMTLAGRVYLDAGRVTGGTVERLAAGGEEVVDLAVVAGRVRAAGDRWVAALTVARKTSGLHARRADGAALERLEISWWQEPQEPPPAGDGEAPAAGASEYPGPPARQAEAAESDEVSPPEPESPAEAPAAEPAAVAGEASAVFRDDFAALAAAVDELAAKTARGDSDALSAAPFRRAAVLPALFAALGFAPREWCCLDGSWMPPPLLDAGAGGGGGPFAAAGIKTFYRYCALCHETPEPTPPNFLYGPPERVRANLAHCAERIFFRLGMWRLTPDERPKTPMPPTNALPGLHLSAASWPQDPDLEALRRYVTGLLTGETGRAPSLEALDSRGYDSLRACLATPAGG
jgi:hypothetical protein